eukprot:UN04883
MKRSGAVYLNLGLNLFHSYFSLFINKTSLPFLTVSQHILFITSFCAGSTYMHD